MPRASTLVVISLYEPRGTSALVRLLRTMAMHDPGSPYELSIVVNRDASDTPLSLPPEASHARVLARENRGMNIGAWDHGWRLNPGFEHYLFLQDECVVQRADWLAAFLDAAREHPGAMIGESYNAGWDRPWQRLRAAQDGNRMRGHELGGQPANRVDVYLDFMRRHGIVTGERGGHLRSLIWFASGKTLQAIDGFPIGENYGECIAAEIATSKKLEAAGFTVHQLASDAFKFIGHVEWQRAGADGRWHHVPVNTDARPVAQRRPPGTDALENPMTSKVNWLSVDGEGRIPTRYVDHLLDDDLKVLNDLLPWQCFTLDSQGRQFGKPASASKRNAFQPIPDPRIVEFNERFELDGQTVLEIGCFEGIHTIALANAGANVIAIDSRIENVVKTIVRTWSFGFHVTAFKCDVEREADFAQVPQVDAAHHMGVLYHLVDPVAHLHQLMPKVGKALLLDTHYAKEEDATLEYESGGRSYRYKHYREGGRENAFAGMYDHAKWLTLDTLVSLLKAGGFDKVDVAQLRDERNGPRTLIYALR
ncbi:MAG: methyltransferase domain-containing protein [Burkholderiaceae bacterium]